MSEEIEYAPVSISYQFTRVQSKLDPVTLEVNSLIVGLTAFPVGHPHISAYADEEIAVTSINFADPVNPTDDEIRNICIMAAANRNWFNQLRSQIEIEMTTPIDGSVFTI